MELSLRILSRLVEGDLLGKFVFTFAGIDL